MSTPSGGAQPSRRLPVIVSSVPAGRIQITLFPSLPTRQCWLLTQMVRSALTYQSPTPDRSALGSLGGSSRMVLVTGQFIVVGAFSRTVALARDGASEMRRPAVNR